LSGRRTSFGKLERERAKKAKAVAKREQRAARSEDSDDPDELDDDAVNGNGSREAEMPAEQVLELVDQLHQRFDAKLIDYESFEEQKADLLGRLRVD
jgi:hypothetical protein